MKELITRQLPMFKPPILYLKMPSQPIFVVDRNGAVPAEGSWREPVDAMIGFVVGGSSNTLG